MGILLFAIGLPLLAYIAAILNIRQGAREHIRLGNFLCLRKTDRIEIMPRRPYHVLLMAAALSLTLLIAGGIVFGTGRVMPADFVVCGLFSSPSLILIYLISRRMRVPGGAFNAQNQTFEHAGKIIARFDDFDMIVLTSTQEDPRSHQFFPVEYDNHYVLIRLHHVGQRPRDQATRLAEWIQTDVAAQTDNYLEIHDETQPV